MVISPVIACDIIKKRYPDVLQIRTYFTHKKTARRRFDDVSLAPYERSPRPRWIRYQASR